MNSLKSSPYISEFTNDKKNTSVMTSLRIGDIFVFDIANDMNIIASLSRACDTPSFKSLKDYISSSALEELEGHIKSYEKAPLLLRTELGYALCFTELFASASLGVLLVPYIPDEALIRLLKTKDHPEVRFSREIPEFNRKINKRSLTYSEKLDESMSIMTSCFSGCGFKPLDYPKRDIGDRLSDISGAISSLVGCPIRASFQSPMISAGDFDMSLYTATMLLLSIAAKNHSPRREIRVSVEQRNCGGTVNAFFERSREDIGIPQEIATLMSIASRKNMLFENMSDEASFRIAFSPINREWSYLELKNHDE